MRTVAPALVSSQPRTAILLVSTAGRIRLHTSSPFGLRATSVLYSLVYIRSRFGWNGPSGAGSLLSTSEYASSLGVYEDGLTAGPSRILRGWRLFLLFVVVVALVVLVQRYRRKCVCLGVDQFD